MEDGTASHTARSVAARRLEYARVEADYGDPAADESLMTDVAAGKVPNPGRMHEYIRARTAFFDRAVVDSIDAGIGQVVIGGAGYDGRALRYAKPGVRWFEVDHPATSADKLERLARLNIDTRHIRFIHADFTVDPITEPLITAGLDAAAPALFLLEGVAVYLAEPVIARVLAAFRAATAEGSLLAISISVGGATSETRARFRERVAAIGEPARSVLTPERATALLAASGWEIRDTSDRMRRAGLLTARAADTHQPERKVPPPVPPAPLEGASPAQAPGASRLPSASPDTPPTAAKARLRSAAGRGLAKAASEEAAPDGAASVGQQAALPLSALLSQTLVALTIEIDNETEHRLPHRTATDGLPPGAPVGAPWLTSMLMWANCLRHLPDEGITLAELRRRARTGTNLDGMRRWRYVTYTPDPGHGKKPRQDAIVAPTVWGSRYREVWQAVTEDVESRWRDRLGAQAFEELRTALAAIAARLDPALPDCLPILGYGLYSRARASPEPEAPVASDVAQDVTDLPLWALLSKALLAFARQYEQEPGPSLAISANILRVLSADGIRTRDIPDLAGVSKESVAMAAGVLAKAGLATEGPDQAGGRFKVTRLTARGVAARDEYPALAADIEADWRARLGPDRVAALRAALEPLTVGDPSPLFAAAAPYPDNWRARIKPPVTLPHYPMTLHRGGYPDGS